VRYGRFSACNLNLAVIRVWTARFERETTLPTHPYKRSRVLWGGLFALLASSLSIPFLLVNEPPLLDYPNHLARVFILNHLHDPAFHFSQFYLADWKPYPYILWDVLMVALQQVLPVQAAGKLLLILTTVLLPVAIAWFLWQANRTEIKLSLLACALSYYLLFLWGFTAYHLGMSFCFLMVGTWLWYRRVPSVTRAVLFLVLCFVTYLAHLLCFAIAAFILVLFELTRPNWRECFRLACFLAPPSLLCLWSRPGLREHGTLRWHSIIEKLQLLRRLPIQGYDKRLDIAFLAGLLLCLLIAVWRNRELRVNWRWLVVTVGIFVVYLLLPGTWGTNWGVDMRLVPPLCLLTLAVLRVGRRANWIAVLAVALTVVRVVNITEGFRRETQKNAAMNDGIERIPRDARLFPLVSWPGDPKPVDHYYAHYWAYAVIRRGDTSGALFDIPGQTPMRATYEPYTHSSEEGVYDWKFVSMNYDYIWSYGDEHQQQSINEIADKVFEEGPLILYRVRRQ
jgi:hypothetical protein